MDYSGPFLKSKLINHLILFFIMLDNHVNENHPQIVIETFTEQKNRGVW